MAVIQNTDKQIKVIAKKGTWIKEDYVIIPIMYKEFWDIKNCNRICQETWDVASSVAFWLLHVGILGELDYFSINKIELDYFSINKIAVIWIVTLVNANIEFRKKKKKG